MIDPNSGAVAFDDGLSIDARTPLAQMQTILDAKAAPSIPGRTQLSLGSHPYQGESWGVGATYVGTKLSQLGLMCLTARGVDSAAWNIENEKLRKIVHDTLVDQLSVNNNEEDQSGHSLVCQFPWGKVSSILDVKGVQALIVVEYLSPP